MAQMRFQLSMKPGGAARSAEDASAESPLRPLRRLSAGSAARSAEERKRQERAEGVTLPAARTAGFSLRAQNGEVERRGQTAGAPGASVDAEAQNSAEVVATAPASAPPMADLTDAVRTDTTTAASPRTAFVDRLQRSFRSFFTAGGSTTAPDEL